MRVADYLLSRLADLGLRDVFFLPGGGAMYLDDALACEKRLNAIACHHEQACGIAAEANGRTNEAGFGVALVTTGPGSTNILTPVAGAWIESLPMMVISGQVKRADALAGRPLRQGGVQEVDIVPMVKPITKFAATLVSPEQVRHFFEEALWLMREGRPGPVWLDVPLDVQAAQIQPETLVEFEPPQQDKSGQIDLLAEAVLKLNGLLSKSERPLIIAGHGVRISGAAEQFRALVDELNIPCVFTWNALDLLPADHPLNIGRPGVVAARAPNFAVQNCDCLISIGCRLDNIITAYNPKGFAREASKIVVDVDANELNRHEMEIALPILSDAKEFISAWAKTRIDYPSWTSWKKRCLDWRGRYPALDGRVFETGSPISHYQFVDVVSDVIPENHLIVTGSSGLAIEVLYTVFRNKVGQRMFLTSGLGSMGYGLPAAIGACIGSGRTPTVCFESDGSLMLNLQELAVLKSQNLPIVLIVMNNDGYASIRNTQKNYFSGRYLGTSTDSGLYVPDLITLAEVVGIPALRITKIEDVDDSISNAIALSSPSLIEVVLQKEETLSPKCAVMPQKNGGMVSMPLEDMSPLLIRDQLRLEMIVPLHPRSEQIEA